MERDGFVLSREQAIQAQQALDIASLNGILSIAIVLKKRGLLTRAEGESMHASITKPLSVPEVANNPLVQDAQQNLDNLFSYILRD